MLDHRYRNVRVVFPGNDKAPTRVPARTGYERAECYARRVNSSFPKASSGAQPDRGVARGAGDRHALDPEVVARLGHLDVRARLVVEGFIAGMHRSPFHGFSVEFAEHRPYMPGDPLKSIDWKVWARSDRYLVKQYTEETNLRCHVLVDLSGSMGFK